MNGGVTAGGDWRREIEGPFVNMVVETEASKTAYEIQIG
ncbi:hypothetical protein TIFTF001_016485 [Ficus carica]|uniref:Uncharacterized protein n=1 Tax=Ficus carica TaxID=3494 RepID=A0AA88D9X0_FICCA|nr:hypothetical protein TIFTF001_016485 [Ficus carica]